MPDYAEGDTVRYKPIGGPASKTAEAIGIIREVIPQATTTTASGTATTTGRSSGTATGGEVLRYGIENSHTHKRSTIKESSILGPAE
ncbi:hypothetical protein BO71DRAFT_384700 [Aspergillus ellipticus CBS 707.79]|uniref:Uncharacterized protein n=1 Tax=Aspergillus ellipticus CBS 707.79 TaxID=1448320 RepID=A0A319D3L0_9EURO|nr:hypothetical protein BO71DRAFT_384700 [Aspergillus ellipticus CBS 707.79]